MFTITIPAVGESISEVTLLKWIKKTGDKVERDMVIAEIESEKATFEINAEISGVLTTSIAEGTVLKIGDAVGTINPQASAETTQTQTPQASTPEITPQQTNISTENKIKISPLAAAIAGENNIDISRINALQPDHKINKQDVLNSLQQNDTNSNALPSSSQNVREDKIEKMSNLRKVISRRLVEAKNTTAMLTTFNEVDMSAIMEIRAKYKDAFKKQHDVNLGFMSFFIKAATIALQEYPAVNAYIDNENIIYHQYVDVSIAVSAPKGLVVPVIRNAENLSMADLEKSVLTLATKARDNKLSVEEMTGGTFTITNGGVFGSLMSTPIINLPQSAILGMHKIQDRPMAINGQVVIKPMMYLALSYDHRIIDGRESVGFLVRIKELLETPSLLLIKKDPIKNLLKL